MRNIPTVTKNLLIINILMFVACLVLPRQGIELDNLLSLHFFKSDSFQPYQLFTYMFIHSGFTHLLLNMFALWMFGGIVERTMGVKRFIIFYLVCGLGAGLCQEIAQLIHYNQLETFMIGDVKCINLEGYLQPVSLSSYLKYWSTMGASGAVYGILLAFGMYYPNERMFIIPIPVPIKAKYLVVGYAVIELMDVLTQTSDGVAHIAHLGGMIFGVALILFWRYWDKRNRRRNAGATYVSFENYTRRY